jgi:SAM-dependent methyltransferase
MNVDFERERAWWEAKAPQEEQDLADEAVNRALRWREIERHLEGIHTVLDVGGGTGAFSIPLTRRGFRVTHVDFAAAMLDLARRKAGSIHNIQFAQANAVALPFPDRSFDLVLNTDGAISFCGSSAHQAIREACRVTRQVLILTVSHRAWLSPMVIEGSMQVAGRILPAVGAMFDQGEWHQDQFPENPSLARGATLDYFGTLKAFLPHELQTALEGAGMQVVRCGGLGTLANLCGPETVAQALQDEALFQEFLHLCERFDRELLPNGPGTRERAGLIAVAVKRQASNVKRKAREPG